jgi:ferredoxin
MAINKVWIKEGCTACGLCEEICPDVFNVKDKATINEGVKFSGLEERIKEAARSCPVEIIKYTEE